MDVLLCQVHVQTLQSLAAATVLQKLCLFNCKLDQEAAEQLVASLEGGGFSNLQELDLTGNNVEAPQMQTLLETLQHRDRAPFLKVSVCVAFVTTKLQCRGSELCIACNRCRLPVPLHRLQAQHCHQSTQQNKTLCWSPPL